MRLFVALVLVSNLSFAACEVFRLEGRKPYSSFVERFDKYVFSEEDANQISLYMTGKREQELWTENLYCHEHVDWHGENPEYLCSFFVDSNLKVSAFGPLTFLNVDVSNYTQVESQLAEGGLSLKLSRFNPGSVTPNTPHLLKNHEFMVSKDGRVSIVR